MVSVRDQVNRPVARAHVSLRADSPLERGTRWIQSRVEPPSPAQPQLQSATDAGGGVAFTDVPVGEWVLTCSSPGLATHHERVWIRKGVFPSPVRVVLLPASLLTGTVTGTSGQPLSGVAVAAHRAPRTRYFEFLRPPVRTDAKGAYRFSDLEPGRYWLTVHTGKEIRESDGLVEVPAVSTMDVPLAGGCTASGRVVDAVTGGPVEGVVVTLDIRDPADMNCNDSSQPDLSAGRDADRGQRCMAQAVTGKDGAFLVEDLPPWTLQTVFAHREGYLPYPDTLAACVADVPLVPGMPAEKTIRMARGATVRGTVSTAKGLPVPSAKVTFVYDHRDLGIQESPPALTAADGTYRLAPLPAGRGFLRVLADGLYQPALPEDLGRALSDAEAKGETSVLVPDGGELVADLRVEAGGTIEGRVLVPEGNSPAGLLVRPANLWGSANADETWAATSHDGSFRIAGVRPWKSVAVVVEGPSGAGGLSKSFPLEDGGLVKDIHVTLEPPRTVAGMVIWPEGSAPSGVSLYVTEAPLFESSHSGRARTVDYVATMRLFADPVPVEADGSFTLHARGSDPLLLLGDAPGHAPFEGPRVEFDEEGPPKPVEVRLVRQDRLDGTVLDPKGQPCAGASVYVFPEEWPVGMFSEGRRFRNLEFTANARTDAKGRFQCGGLAPGSHRITVRVPGYREAVAHEKTGKEGLVITMALPKTISGRVVAAEDGKPLAGIRLFAYHDQMALGFELGQPLRDWTTRTGPDGRFVLGDLPEATFDIWFENYYYGSSVGDRIPQWRSHLTAGAKDIEVRLPAGNVIAGRVVNRKGKPLGIPFHVDMEAEVEVRNGDIGGTFRRVDSETGGIFRGSGLRPGRYRVEVKPTWSQKDGGFTPVTVREVEGGTKDLVITVDTD